MRLLELILGGQINLLCAVNICEGGKNEMKSESRIIIK